MDLKIENFERYLSLRGLSIAGVKRQAHCLRIAAPLLQEFSQESVDTFLHSLRTKYKKGSYNYFVLSIRNYAKMIEVEIQAKYLKVDDTKPIQILSPPQLKQLLSLPYPGQGSRVAWHKWTLFLTVCAYTGLRGNEVANIRVQDIDFTQGEIVIPKTKNGRPHWVVIQPTFEKMLKEWVKNMKPNDYVFSNKQGKPHVHQNWQDVLNNRLKLAGITRRVTLHNLRDSYATALANQDVDIHKISNLLNHKDLRSTTKYIHLAHEKLVESTKKHPNVVELLEPNQIINAVKSKIHEVAIPEDKFDKYKYDLAVLEFLEKIKGSILNIRR